MTETAKAVPDTFLESLARDVAMVLRRMGGSAHQKDVCDWVAALRRQRGEQVSPELPELVREVFERYRDWFFRPFGEGSNRWALAPGAA
ncbi:hypothetical protein [Brevundimonas balnearis]|uniref:Uncharacterized protein n=1 Tax=Brevundimonas balnearis TaxID=1572858 RepID=A0ABV6R5W2_9CAUL